MMLNESQIKELEADLDEKHVKHRTQVGFTLSYVEGWWAIAEANRIFGHDCWHRETVDLRHVADETDDKGRAKTGYIAKVRITVNGPEDKEDIIREGVGFGNAINKSAIDAHEMAAKEAETDATKRALMTFGWPFGLALYDKNQEHVSDNGRKNPVRGMGSVESLDHAGADDPGPSPQALRIRDEFRLAPNVTVLETYGVKHKKTISALHKDDKAFLADQYKEIKKGLEDGV